MTSQSPRGPIEHREPLVVPPKSGTHKQSFVVLHGRGSNGHDFGSQLLLWSVPGFNNLQTAFPDAKFVFPTAAMRRVQACNRLTVNQWFDCWSLKDPSEREELQYEGLKESTEYVHRFLREEISTVGASNVVLWGLSQGWATSMVALLLWEGEPFAAAIGMCGWLPLENRMRAVLSSQDSAEDGSRDRQSETDVGGSSNRGGKSNRIAPVVEYLRDILEMPVNTKNYSALDIPVIVGHGEMDEKVAVELGLDAVDLLRTLRVRVEYRQYSDLMHWYSDEMLHDVVLFISEVLKWTVSTAPQSG